MIPEGTAILKSVLGIIQHNTWEGFLIKLNWRILPRNHERQLSEQLFSLSDIHLLSVIKKQWPW